MSVAVPSHERYLTDRQGGCITIVLGIDACEALLDQLNELEAIRVYGEAKASGDERTPFEQAVKEIEEGCT